MTDEQKAARKRALYSMNMTPRQMARARPMVMKYAGQLARLANEKAQVETASVEQVVAQSQVETARTNNWGRF